MKTIKIVLLLIALVPFNNIFSQYFIDQDKVDEFKANKQKYYRISKSEEKDKKIYLQQFSSTRNYYSDIKIGFDKDAYKQNDKIVLTLKRGFENKADSESVLISGCSISSSSTHIEQNNGYSFYIRKGEEVNLTLNCKPRDGC